MSDKHGLTLVQYRSRLNTAIDSLEAAHERSREVMTDRLNAAEQRMQRGESAVRDLLVAIEPVLEALQLRDGQPALPESLLSSSPKLMHAMHTARAWVEGGSEKPKPKTTEVDDEALSEPTD